MNKFNQGFTELLILKLSLLLLVTNAIGNFVFMQKLITSIAPLKGFAFLSYEWRQSTRKATNKVLL